MDGTQEPMIYTLLDEEDQEHTFELLDSFEQDDVVYYAMTPYADTPEELVQTSGDLVILKGVEESGEEFLQTIDDDAEYDRIGSIFMERIEAMFDLPDEDEEP